MVTNFALIKVKTKHMMCNVDEYLREGAFASKENSNFYAKKQTNMNRKKNQLSHNDKDGVDNNYNVNFSVELR